MARTHSLAIVDNGHGWAVLVDGLMECGGFASEQAAIDWYFSEKRGGKAIGYPLAFITDGAVFCAACARSFWMEPGRRHDQIRDGVITPFFYQDSAALACSECDEWISEPLCLGCGLPESEFADGLFQNESGDDPFMCMLCMAKAVWAGRTHQGVGYRAYKKWGIGTYTLYKQADAGPGEFSWWGVYSRPAFNRVEQRIDAARAAQ